MKNVSQRETVLLAQGDVDAFLGGGSLKLEIERPAESFAQRESPGFVDAASKRRVNYQLHPPRFVKEPFGNHGFLGRHSAQHRSACRKVFHQLCRAGVFQAALVLEPCLGLGRLPAQK